MNAAERVLELWKRLSDGEILELKQLKTQYNRSEIQLKRDIQSIRNTFGEDAVLYDWNRNYYYSSRLENNLTIGNAFLMVLLLYNSRSLEKEECRSIADNMISRFSDREQIQLRKFFRSFDVHYKSITVCPISDTLSYLVHAIIEQRKVSFPYPNNNLSTKPEPIRNRTVEPLMITYQKGCFYLLAQDEGNKKHYRIDRIKDLIVTDMKFRLNLGAQYLEVGEYHNRAFNMFSGEKITVHLKVANHAVEYLRRECPQVNIIRTNESDQTQIVEIETLGEDGILFWILSQQDWVEVLAPQKLRERMVQIIQNMSQLYQGFQQK